MFKEYLDEFVKIAEEMPLESLEVLSSAVLKDVIAVLEPDLEKFAVNDLIQNSNTPAPDDLEALNNIIAKNESMRSLYNETLKSMPKANKFKTFMGNLGRDSNSIGKGVKDVLKSPEFTDVAVPVAVGVGVPLALTVGGIKAIQHAQRKQRELRNQYFQSRHAKRAEEVNSAIEKEAIITQIVIPYIKKIKDNPRIKSKPALFNVINTIDDTATTYMPETTASYLADMIKLGAGPQTVQQGTTASQSQEQLRQLSLLQQMFSQGQQAQGQWPQPSPNDLMTDSMQQPGEALNAAQQAQQTADLQGTNPRYNPAPTAAETSMNGAGVADQVGSTANEASDQSAAEKAEIATMLAEQQAQALLMQGSGGTSALATTTPSPFQQQNPMNTPMNMDPSQAQAQQAQGQMQTQKPSKSKKSNGASETTQAAGNTQKTLGSQSFPGSP